MPVPSCTHTAEKTFISPFTNNIKRVTKKNDAHNFAQKKPMPLGYRALLDGLHTAPIYEIEIPKMAEDGLCPDVQINDLKFLGSYDWTEAESPTIVVPGTLSPSSDLTPG